MESTEGKLQITFDNEKVYLFFKNYYHEKYFKYIILARYCDYRRLSYDLEEKYKYNPIVLMISGYLGETVVP